MKNILTTLFQIICIIFFIPVIAILAFFVFWYTSILFPVLLIAEALSEVYTRTHPERTSNMKKWNGREWSNIVEPEPFTVKRVFTIWAGGLKMFS